VALHEPQVLHVGEEGHVEGVARDRDRADDRIDEGVAEHAALETEKRASSSIWARISTHR
jgi:hypothetical protein